MAQYWLASPWSERPRSAFDQLRRGMDELFERVGADSMQRATAFPPVNLYETTDGFVLTAELPGLRSEEIQLSIGSNRVTLRGERRIEHPENASVHRVERPGGAFHRTVELPLDVDADKAQAVHRNGVLMLRIPKAPVHQPRQIAVQAS